MKNRLKSGTLLLGLLAGGSQVSAEVQSPRIVVGIMVDQLRTDYLQQLRPYFGDNGFNRLIREGVFIPDVDFHHTVADAPSGTAVVYTGSWPVINGVASAESLDASGRRSVPVLSNPSSLKFDFSPENLRVSTLTDEFFINNGTLSKSYSIAGDPQVAVISAGHAGNAAVWFDESAGKWASPAFYQGLPTILSNKNRTSPLSSKIASSFWRPVNRASTYPGGNNWKDGDFSYTFAGGNFDAFRRFKGSAPFNTEVADAAIDLLRSMQSSGPGMLSIAFSAAPYDFDYDGDNRPELTDTYIRLDRELGRILDTIDREYGAGNAVVFLSSTGYVVEPDIPDGDARIPTGEITLRQAESLLNSYLSASYGNGDFVSLIKNGKLYLDRKEISGKGLDVRVLRREAKDFLLKMGGVSEILTLDDVLNSENPRAKELALATDPKNAPDIFLFFQPGWTVTDDNAYPAVSKKVRLATPAVPAFILAPQLAPKTVEYPVDATALAPTIATTINIRAPNAASTRPLNLELIHKAK